MASPGGGYAFYVSNKFGTSGNKDIYMVMMSEKFRKKVGVFSGIVTIDDIFQEVKDTTQIKIYVIDPSSHDTIQTYQPNPDDGSYTMILPATRSYIVSYDAQGMLSHVETVYVEGEADLHFVKKVIPLQPIILGAGNEDYHITFKEGTDSIDYSSKIKLNKITSSLQTYRELISEIKTPSNDSLYKERTVAIMDYFIESKIDTARINLQQTNNSYFEVLVADTLFLSYAKRDWTVNFFPNSTETDKVSQHKMDDLSYFLNMNKELFIEVPFDPKDTSQVAIDRATYILNYFVTNGIDASTILVIPPPGESSEHVKLRVSNTRGDRVLLFDILQSLKNGNFNRQKNNTIFVKVEGGEPLSEEKKEELLNYFAENSTDTTGVTFRTFNRFIDKNKLRSHIKKENNMSFENLQWNEKYISVNLTEQNQVIKKSVLVTGIPPRKKKQLAYQRNTANKLRNQLKKTRTLGVKYTQIKTTELAKVPHPNNEDNCEYLFDNVNSKFYKINFDYDKSQTEETVGLDSIADCLVLYPEVKLEMDGHTDGKGSLEYNKKLAQKRADFIKEYMVKQGAKKKQIKTKSYGKLRPIAPNTINGADYINGRKLNRRVELKVIKANRKKHKIK